MVRFVGEPVAAVIAASEEEAEDIADQVELDIAEAKPVVDARAALAAGAPQIHAEAPGNVIVEGKFKTRRFRCRLERRAQDRQRRRALAPPERDADGSRAAATPPTTPSTGRVTLTCTTQMPHLTRTAIADVLGMPESDLRVIAPDVGGGFGQKMSLAAEYVVLVWLARKLQKLGRLDRGPARKPDRRLPCARPVHHACKAPSTRTPS